MSLTGRRDRAVRLLPDPHDDPALAAIGPDAARLGTEGVAAMLRWARVTGAGVSLPGSGATLGRWEWLATVAASDLTVARVAEPHLDALAILAEAGGADPDPDATWGVYAAEGPGVRLTATHHEDGGWTLSGTKPWCSLAGQVSHALVTAWTTDDTRAMFAVDLGQDGVDVESGAWCPAGLSDVVTATLHLDEVPARAVGGPGWYLERPGFAWGGIGVAAVWFGGAVGLFRRMVAQSQDRELDQVGLMHLGAVDADLTAAAAVLSSAASAIDMAAVTDSEARTSSSYDGLLAARVRHVVADVAERTLVRAGHALGAGPLAHEPDHVRRVADLTLYVRQHHAERDSAALGRHVLDGPSW